jgi:hypothetical protein
VIDHGDYTMARTLGSGANQVSANGRRVIVGWILGGKPASQSLARDLSFSPSRELLQRFVPELEGLRRLDTHARLAGDTPAVHIGQQFEAVARFNFPPMPPVPPAPPAGEGWEALISKGTFGTADAGAAAFERSVAASPTAIVRRECADCLPSHRWIFYRRLTPLSGLDLHVRARPI